MVLVLQGCVVSKKKFDDLLAQKVKTDGELAEATSRLEKANTDINSLQSTLNQLKQDTAQLGDARRMGAQKLEALNNEYDQLNAYYKNLLNSSGKLNRDLTLQKEQLLAIQDNLERTRKANDSLSTSQR